MSHLRAGFLEASYGASQALFGIDIEIAPGEVVALMGRNGMGKTTTVKAICRMLPSTGTLEFGGKDLYSLKSHQAARLGIGLVPEGRRCFASLTVNENLRAVARSRNGGNDEWNIARVGELFPRLAERGGQMASSLSGGEQQMLAIGRALMTNPKLLILDEATEGLAPIVRQEIWRAIAQLKSETGLSILLIDKSLKEMRGICDKAVIIERGKSVWSGGMDELSHSVTNQYLGV